MKHSISRTRLLIVLLVCLCSPVSMWAQMHKVTGTVLDDLQQPMPGVSIIVKGETRGVITDVDGKYSIEVTPSNVLQFDFLGFEPMEETVGDRKVINVTMAQKANELDGVTFVAFSKQKKESVIASIATVNPSTLKVPSSNLTTALAGRASGIISYQVSGEPGQDNAQFFVRGISSFGATAKKDPLILIDNIEMTSTDLARLTPDDIASFSVMKDATAAALYGARGANGVILITTKSGTEGKAKLNFRYESSLSQPTRNVELADPVTYMLLHNEAVKTRNPIAQLPYSQEKIANTMDPGANSNVYPTNDWNDMLFKKMTVNHRFNFNLSGGGAITNYYISAAYNRDNGILKNDPANNFKNNIELNRYVLRANFNVNVTPTTKVTVRLHGAFDDYSGPLEGGTALYKTVMNSNPVAFPAFFVPDDILAERKHVMFGNNSDGSYTNPYAEMVKGFKQYSTSTMLAQIELTQDLKFITKGLSARILANTDRYSYFDLRREMTPYYYTLGTYDRDTGMYTVRSLNEGSNALSYTEGAKDVNSSLYMEAAIDYNRTFKKKHAVTGLLVLTLQQKLYGNVGTLQESLPYRNMGLAGRFTYAYDSRYFLEANFGYNGSERFDKKHRWGFFPSAGLGYIVSNEKFYPAGLKRVISMLKLKATYGLVGNDAIGDGRFFYLSNVNLNDASQSISFGSLLSTSKPGVTISQYANPDISWEISRKMNLGLEMNIFEDLNVQFDYFTENRSNILMTRSYVPSTAGFEAPISANVGEAFGKGCEVALQYNHSFGNDMWLTATGNFTYATSEYKVYEEPDYADTPWLSHVGMSLGQTYGYVAERLFVDDREVYNSPTQEFSPTYPTAAGDIKYKDINGDGIISSLDKVPIGYPYTPEIIYGFGASFGWKGFDISAFFQGSARSSFWIDPSEVAPFIGGQRALLADIANSVWTEDNRNVYAFWPRLSEGANENNTQTSTWFMRDGSFLRLKSAELGYTLPNKVSKQIGIETARIYLSGTNLLTFSKFKLWDPEMKGNGLGYPIQRVFNIGVQINF